MTALATLKANLETYPDNRRKLEMVIPTTLEVWENDEIKLVTRSRLGSSLHAMPVDEDHAQTWVDLLKIEVQP